MIFHKNLIDLPITELHKVLTNYEITKVSLSTLRQRIHRNNGYFLTDDEEATMLRIRPQEIGDAMRDTLLAAEQVLVAWPPSMGGDDDEAPWATEEEDELLEDDEADPAEDEELEDELLDDEELEDELLDDDDDELAKMYEDYIQ